MSNNLWSRFDSIAKPEEVTEARSQFTPIEEGVYSVTLEELIAGESKSGLPMLKGKFRMIEGNRVIFYNQVLQNLNNEWMTTKNIAEAVEFVNGLLGEEVDFTGLGAFGELIGTIPIGTIHTIKVFYGDNDYEKKFTKLKIVDESELPMDVGSTEGFSGIEGFHPIDNDDIPF